MELEAIQIKILIKKEMGKNILSVLGRENSIAGQSFLNNKDKIILGFYFDRNVGSYESTISLGDSGSPPPFR